MKRIFAAVSLFALACGVLPALGEETLFDPTRPVSMLGQTEFTVQWSTLSPCATRLQLREGGEPCMTWRPAGQEYRPWAEGGRIVENGATGVFHRLTVTGLQPGKRYYYRLYDEAAEPTGLEADWGAEKPWTREYAVATLSPEGYRTVVRVPVKVLIMPNVYSLYGLEPGQYPALPAPMGEAEKANLVRDYRIAERFWFVNNGFRVWYDLQIFWDERPQYWGELPADAPEEYRALARCRSFSGEEYRFPGGGTFTIVDLKDIARTNLRPVHDGYVGQIENAVLRRYDARSGRWVLRTSGGGTFGPAGWRRGEPGRSQYLGDDIAWLTAHEFHHQIEGIGVCSGLDSEDDRVVYDHFINRHRFQLADGEWDETTWDLSAKCGDHWSGIAMTDRQLTDVQWLRVYFGEAVMVPDQDGDGVPDRGNLPFTEEAQGYDPECECSDGEMNDFAKIRQSIWSGGILQPCQSRKPENLPLPDPEDPDSDGDGLADGIDPLPLVPYEPYIWYHSAEVDGSPAEWADVPLSGAKTVDGVTMEFKQCHDEGNYYALLTLKGRFLDAMLELDGEGHGIFSGNDAPGGSRDYYEFRISPAKGTVRKLGRGEGAETALRQEGDTTYVEISIENRGQSTWFWKGGGREVGSIASFRLPDGAAYSLGDGYQPVYCFMRPCSGVLPCPLPLPAELTEAEADVALDFSAAPDLSRAQWDPASWELKDGALRALPIPEGQDPNFLLPGFEGGDFAIWMEFEAEADAVLGAFASGTESPDPGKDSVGFLGGYGNALSKIRLKGLGEVCEKRLPLTPGRHTMQFQRQGRHFFMLYDGQEAGWCKDATIRAANRLGVVGCPGNGLKVYKLRVKGGK